MSENYRANSNALGYQNQRAILVYDLSIEDLKARRDAVQKFDTIQYCADYFKTGRNNIFRAIGKRFTDKRDSKVYAIRECGTKPGEPGYGMLSVRQLSQQLKDKK